MEFKVKVQPSGHEFTVEEDETVLEAALRQGFAFPYGCRNGACGTCQGKILSGTVTYDGPAPPGLIPEEEAEGRALFCSAYPLSDLVVEMREIGAAKDIVVKTLPCRVTGMEKLAADVMRLYLKLPAAERLQFLAGQYLDILLRDGGRRGFSIANAPHDDAHIELHVRHLPGGRFSDHVFARMKEKDLLRFQGPLGSFFLREESDRPILMIGGGTGFAPLKGMLEHVFHAGIQRPIHLYWGARGRRDLYLHDLPLSWSETHSDFRYTPVLSEPLAEDAWEGRTGFVHDAVVQDYPDLGAYEVYMSGPPPMIEAAKQAFRTHGLPFDHLYYDSFEPARDSRSTVA
ncbi:MAG: CDP-6-deoxy-delta-3,4-glucoseen reductase [Chromatiales bacterium 21-64-14]|nr:MAG: CDP-6-deoxy-delta-3,4-glucoseen reductase [Chromatiales bacterium 21-64-14]HQU14512.1 CDP-6-deoxy-delta-3,4-glucoseen reductase [Gammaproteobacteria bacterium]